MHRMHFNHQLGFFYGHKSVIDTIFNISWQISIMKSKKVIKCHFVSELSCKYKCWMLKQLLATFYLKKTWQIVSMPFVVDGLYLFPFRVCLSFDRDVEPGSWEVFLSLIQIACRDRIRGSLFRPSLAKPTKINATFIANKKLQERKNDMICLSNHFYFQDMI